MPMSPTKVPCFAAGLAIRPGDSLPVRRCTLRPRACARPATSEPLPAALARKVGETGVHPGYVWLRPPHLREYLPDLRAHPSPLVRCERAFIDPEEVVLRSVVVSPREIKPTQAFTRAGPRRDVYFGPGARAAIVSCGGICPGINTVIRELTLCLGQYDVGVVFGIQHGFVSSSPSLCLREAQSNLTPRATMATQLPRLQGALARNY